MSSSQLQERIHPRSSQLLQIQSKTIPIEGWVEWSDFGKQNKSFQEPSKLQKPGAPCSRRSNLMNYRFRFVMFQIQTETNEQIKKFRWANLSKQKLTKNKNVIKSPRLEAKGDMTLSGLIRSCFESITNPIISKHKIIDEIAADETALAASTWLSLTEKYASLKVKHGYTLYKIYLQWKASRMVSVITVMETTKNETIIAWAWTRAIFEPSIDNWLCSSFPRFAKVASRDANVISIFPFNPNKAGRSM